MTRKIAKTDNLNKNNAKIITTPKNEKNTPPLSLKNSFSPL